MILKQMSNVKYQIYNLTLVNDMTKFNIINSIWMNKILEFHSKVTLKNSKRSLEIRNITITVYQ